MGTVPGLSAEIIGVFAGGAQDLWPGRPPSAIAKRPVSGPMRVGPLGLVADAQADSTVHGGPEKARHHYPAEHYPDWRAELEARNPRFRPGGFGENISTIGLTETTLCIGDVLEIGTARVQISQGRQPCWKLSAHTDRADMASQLQKSGRTGWYYRILAEGAVAVGDRIVLLERPHPDWTLARVIAARFDPSLAAGTARTLARLDALAPRWRAAFGNKAKGGHVENTDARLKG